MDNALLIGQIAADQNPWWSDPAARRASQYPVARDLLDALLRHVQRQGDRRAAVVIGPRQVGKTTLLLQIADRALKEGWPAQNLTYFNFDDDRLNRPVAAR